MSLTEQLATQKAQSLASFPEDVKNRLLGDLDDLGQSGMVDRAPKEGDQLKDFVLINHLGEERNLASLRAKGPVVITFYRGGWCPYCNLELRAYQAVLEEIQATGATLVAITPELPDASLSTKEKNELTFEVLTDTNADYARSLGLVFTLPEATRPIYEKFGIAVEEHNGKGQFDFPLAATFIVDVDGTVISSYVNVDYTLRQDPKDVIEKLKAHKG